jgi:hypothetical protein
MREATVENSSTAGVAERASARYGSAGDAPQTKLKPKPAPGPQSASPAVPDVEVDDENHQLDTLA